MNEDISKIPSETLKEIISFKKSRLHQLKADGWFKRSGRISTAECNRRRAEIQELIEELSRRG